MKRNIYGGDNHISLSIEKSQAQFTRIKNPHGADTGIGSYFLIVDVKAGAQDVYIPLSIASGKKVTGFVYQIEGTGVGSLMKSEIAVRGEGVKQVVLGTLLYTKIPQGAIASFRIHIEVKGKVGKAYSVRIHQVNYKLNPTDARYKKLESRVETKVLTFS